MYVVSKKIISTHKIAGAVANVTEETTYMQLYKVK